MKKAFILCFALLLTACIDVDDYGDYWSKTTIDPTLSGRWEKLIEDDDDKNTNQEWVFTKKDDGYEVRSIIDGKSEDDDKLYPVRTLTVGPYKFAASGPDKGTIVRYELEEDDVVTWDVLDPQATWEYIEKHFPGQYSLYRIDVDDTVSEEEAAYRPIKIRMFDDTAYKILSSIPDTDKYWGADTSMIKAK